MMNENPESVRYVSMAEGLQRMEESPTVIHVTLGMLLSHFRQSHPITQIHSMLI